jgi:nitrogen-specific signal transduction histidine kinase/CheY-like chemotaxis protein
MDKIRKFDRHREPRSGAPERMSPAGRGKDGAPWMSEDLQDSLLQRIARLEAALTLTAGTVHDVNNVLTVLAGNLFLLTESVRGQPQLYEQARRARNAAERGSTLLRELLTFDRSADDTARAISPANHVQALQPMLSRAIGAEHDLRVDLDSQAGSVVASAAQFESVVINLVINARDALREHGCIEVKVRNDRLDTEKARTLGIAPGEYVLVQVADNGTGIPARYLARVTEPLFSTKPPDRGSGLGLCMVQRFAAQSDGALRIESTEGQGTCVHVWLPRSGKVAETTANMTLPLSTLPGGDEILLLVSPVHDLRASLQQILETLGYTVLLAGDAEQAERMMMQDPPPALLLAERSRHGNRAERGWLARLKETNVELRHVALLQAGTDAREAAPDADAYLFRPVTIPDLAQTVRAALAGSKQPRHPAAMEE